MKQEKTLLRHLRHDRELTLDFLRAKTGVNVATISRGERRLQPISEKDLARLAKFLKVSPPQALLEDASKWDGRQAA